MKHPTFNKIRNVWSQFIHMLAIAIFLVVPVVYAWADAEDTDMEGMSHNDHEMTPDMFDELRAKIPLYKDYTDEQMRATMQMMAPNYEVYVSNEGVNGPLGVLVLAHGAGEVGDRTLRERIDPIGQIFPMSISFGMTMMQSSHIQSAFNDSSVFPVLIESKPDPKLLFYRVSGRKTGSVHPFNRSTGSIDLAGRSSLLETL